MRLLRVFISSTSLALNRYREELAEALKEVAEEVICMDGWGSLPVDPITASLDKVGRCNLFIGLYGQRYGEFNEESGKSITEEEYDFAGTCGIRRLVYLADESIHNPIEEPEWKKERLKVFKNRLLRNLVIHQQRFFSPELLCQTVRTDIVSLIKGEPLGYSFSEVRENWAEWKKNEGSQTIVRDFEDLPVNVETALLEIWRNFTTAKGWGSIVKEKILSICDSSRDFDFLEEVSAKLDEIDLSKSYEISSRKISSIISNNLHEQIRSNITKLILGNDGKKKEETEKLKKIHEDIRKVEELVEKLSYQKCFLLCGGQGSGKTHFFSNILERTDQNEALLLPLDPVRLAYDPLNFEEEVLRSITFNPAFADLFSILPNT